ncbi:multiple sugar transport system substrate-binding protein [Kribbella sp. VKM Ac-2571]|uniref:extracellular solute-binding protein n=1 Tax=Kribbella sp. VKM Ac-2571 TaxID=2512222 RepID=UPI00105F9454|nr:extracellular solute-binding protein [Kribbella sp. VKM Ac-2571]TDO66568.1 multiple sugar transport system substrate-binding protein [Kribbella sp. VKM Ac-2571]
MNTLTRRTLLGLGAATAAAITVPGCSGKSGPMRVSWYGPDPVTKALNKALDAWKSSGGAEYTAESAPFDDYWDKLATQTSGNNAPDVLRMSMSYFSDYAGRSALKDLGSLGIDTSGLDKDVAASGVADGKNYGIGQSSISYSMYVDEGAIKKAGGTVPAQGWTWDKFAEFARDYSGSVQGSFGSSDQAGNFQLFEVYARQHGTEMFSDDGGKLLTTKETVQEWFQYWADLRSAKAAPPQNVSGETTGIEKSLIATGKAPLQFGWVQQVTFYQPLVKSPLAVLPVPQGKAGDLTGQFVKGLDLWCISAASKDPEDAAKLIGFLLNDEKAIKAIGILLGVPPSKKARDLVSADAGSAGARAIKYVEDLAGKVGPSPKPWPKGYGELLTGFDRIAENIGFGKSNPAAGAQEFVDLSGKTLGQ